MYLFLFEMWLQPLYSFGRKNGKTLFPAGPCKESFQHGYLKLHRNIPCAVYKLDATDEVYANAKQEVEKITERADEFYYNTRRLLLSQAGIRSRRKKYFFCSQFVSEVLKRSNALKLSKDASLMKPCDYMHMTELVCCYKGCIGDFVQSGIMSLCHEGN